MVHDSSVVIPFVGMPLGVFKLWVTETTDEPEKICWGSHVGRTGHPDPVGDTDMVTVTCIVPSCDGMVHA